MLTKDVVEIREVHPPFCGSSMKNVVVFVNFCDGLTQAPLVNLL